MAAKLPSVPARRVVRAFERVGFAVDPGRGKGSHIALVRQSDNVRLIVPNHNPVSKGTLRSLISAAGLSVEQFITLL